MQNFYHFCHFLCLGLPIPPSAVVINFLFQDVNQTLRVVRAVMRNKQQIVLPLRCLIIGTTRKRITAAAAAAATAAAAAAASSFSNNQS